MELIDFLRARLDEDEQTARAATPGPWSTMGQRVLDPSPPSGRLGVGMAVGHAAASADYNETATHIACHDPARVLREVEAKRLILAEYENENRVMERGHRTAWTDGGQAARHTVLKAFALSYADHPDYNHDWRL